MCGAKSGTNVALLKDEDRINYASEQIWLYESQRSSVARSSFGEHLVGFARNRHLKVFVTGWWDILRSWKVSHLTTFGYTLQVNYIGTRQATMYNEGSMNGQTNLPLEFMEPCRIQHNFFKGIADFSPQNHGIIVSGTKMIYYIKYSFSDISWENWEIYTIVFTTFGEKKECLARPTNSGCSGIWEDK